MVTVFFLPLLLTSVFLIQFSTSFLYGLGGLCLDV